MGRLQQVLCILHLRITKLEGSLDAPVAEGRKYSSQDGDIPLDYSQQFKSNLFDIVVCQWSGESKTKQRRKYLEVTCPILRFTIQRKKQKKALALLPEIHSRNQLIFAVPTESF